MRTEALAAAAAGFGVAAVAGLAGILWIRAKTAGGKPLAPQALFGAVALRFALTLAGAVALALAWRSEATAMLVGVGVGYLALLFVETRWTMARARAAGGVNGPARGAPDGEKE